MPSGGALPNGTPPDGKAELCVFGPVSCCSGAGVADNARLSPTNAITQLMSRSKSLSLLGLSIALCSSATFADTVWLKNGDRLSGTIRFFDGSKLLLETDYGGSIPLDWKKIATLESDHELLVKLGPVDGERAKSLLAAEPGKVTLANGESPKTIELSQIEQIMKPKPLVEDFTWKGNIDLGLDYKRGERDSDDYDVDIKTQARHGRWRHNAIADYNRELKDDVVSTDNWSAEYALDRFLTEKWFWQGRFEYKRDRIEEVERQRTRYRPGLPVLG